jgi:hypothetical protein
MKLSIGKVFDIATILTTKAGNDLKAFLEHLTLFNEQLIRLAQNNITIDDNLNMERKTITYSPNQHTYDLINLKNPKPSLILLGESTLPIDNPIIFSYRYDGRNNRTQIYLKPLTEPSTKAQVEVVVFYR